MIGQPIQSAIGSTIGGQIGGSLPQGPSIGFGTGLNGSAAVDVDAPTGATLCADGFPAIYRNGGYSCENPTAQRPQR